MFPSQPISAHSGYGYTITPSSGIPQSILISPALFHKIKVEICMRSCCNGAASPENENSFLANPEMTRKVLSILDDIETGREVKYDWKESLAVYFFKIIHMLIEDVKFIFPVFEADPDQVREFLKDPRLPVEGVARVKGFLKGISGLRPEVPKMEQRECPLSDGIALQRMLLIQPSQRGCDEMDFVTCKRGRVSRINRPISACLPPVGDKAATFAYVDNDYEDGRLLLLIVKTRKSLPDPDDLYEQAEGYYLPLEPYEEGKEKNFVCDAIAFSPCRNYIAMFIHDRYKYASFFEIFDVKNKTFVPHLSSKGVCVVGGCVDEIRFDGRKIFFSQEEVWRSIDVNSQQIEEFAPETIEPLDGGYVLDLTRKSKAASLTKDGQVLATIPRRPWRYYDVQGGIIASLKWEGSIPNEQTFVLMIIRAENLKQIKSIKLPDSLWGNLLNIIHDKESGRDLALISCEQDGWVDLENPEKKHHRIFALDIERAEIYGHFNFSSDRNIKTAFY